MHTYVASTHTCACHIDTLPTWGSSTLAIFYRNKDPILSFEISTAIVLQNKLGCEKPDFTKVTGLGKSSFDARCSQMCLRCVYKIKALFQVTSTQNSCLHFWKQESCSHLGQSLHLWISWPISPHYPFKSLPSLSVHWFQINGGGTFTCHKSSSLGV